jgi:hypothetical protein
VSAWPPPGYQSTPPTWNPSIAAYGTSRFDIAAITAEIDRAAASLKADERGSITVQVDKDSAGAGLVVRGPLGTHVLARVVKPYAGRLEWSLSGRVSFIRGPAPIPVRFLADVRGLYRVLRKFENGRAASLLKAFAIRGGAEVRLLG